MKKSTLNNACEILSSMEWKLWWLILDPQTIPGKSGKYTDKIYDFEWIDDFSAARNLQYPRRRIIGY